MRILLIEDDVMFGDALMRGLSEEHMSVDWVKDGADGQAALSRSSYALVLLDIGLPTISGFDLLKQFRGESSAPVLVITARDGDEDLVTGLDLGADDYVIKPFELKVLLARMRAVLRRSAGRSQSLLMSAEIALNPATYVASFREISGVLSAKEYALLYALMERPGAILSRSQLEDRIYGWGEEVQSNAIDFLIHGLRKRYGRDMIRNIRGAGWLVTKD